MSVTGLVVSLLQFYSTLIIIYVLMSWFPVSGFIAEVQQVIGTIVDPYLGLFRRIIPPIGMIDISPIVAILVLNALMNLIYQL